MGLLRLAPEKSVTSFRYPTYKYWPGKEGFFKVESMNMGNEESFHVHLHVKTIRVCELLEKYVNFARWHGISRH